jgi:hypothetical protein
VFLYKLSFLLSNPYLQIAQSEESYIGKPSTHALQTITTTDKDVPSAFPTLPENRTQHEGFPQQLDVEFKHEA